MNILDLYSPQDLGNPDDAYDARIIARAEPEALVSRARSLLHAADRAIARGRPSDAREYVIDAITALRAAERAVNDALARGFPAGWFLDIARSGHATHLQAARIHKRLRMPRRRVRG